METMTTPIIRRRFTRVLILAGLVGLLAALLPAVAGAGPEIHPTQFDQIDGLPAAATIASTGSSDEVLTEPTEAPMPFDTVGFDHPDGVDVEVRTSEDGQEWSPWFEADAIEADDSGPEADEGADDSWLTKTEPVYVREASWLQVRLPPGSDPSELSVELLDSSGQSESLTSRIGSKLRAAWTSTPQAQASANRPSVVSRAGWGANESWRSGSPRYSSNVRYGVVHHTAGTNAYSRSDSPARVRSYYSYHTRTLGWADIGYNILVDRYGVVYEGRAGGLERGVIGAHARGFNAGSFGISVMGNFQNVTPPAEALRSLEQAVAWKFDIHGIDPDATINVTSGGSPTHPAGTTARIPTLIGHRDVGSTACPGTQFYGQLNNIRSRVSNLVAQANVRFLDVNYSGAHGADIDAIAEAGITEGCGPREYCPKRNVTRGEMASFITRTLSMPAVDGSTFSDVSDSDGHRGAIYALAEAGITRGCDDGMYCPYTDVTRAQMASFLTRALDLPDGSDSPFTDLWSGSAHSEDIAALAASGITQGCAPDRFCPNDTVTRDQMASFLERARRMGF